MPRFYLILIDKIFSPATHRSGICLFPKMGQTVIQRALTPRLERRGSISIRRYLPLLLQREPQLPGISNESRVNKIYETKTTSEKEQKNTPKGMAWQGPPLLIVSFPPPTPFAWQSLPTQHLPVPYLRSPS
jgi:hypothetical protein